MRLSDGMKMEGAGLHVGCIAVDGESFVVEWRRADEAPSSSIVESDHRLEHLLLSCVGSLRIRYCIDDGYSLDSDKLLEIDDSHLVSIRVLQTSHEIRSVRIAGEESTGGGSGRRVDIDEDGVLGRFDDRVGVLPQSVSMREQRAIPVESILRDVEHHLARTAVRGDRLERGDEIFLHSSDSNDSSRFLSDSEIDKRDVLVEEVERGVEARLSKGAEAGVGEEGAECGFGGGDGAGRRFEGDAVDELGGDIESVFLLVVREDTAGSEGEKRFWGSRERVFRDKSLQWMDELSCTSLYDDGAHFVVADAPFPPSARLATGSSVENPVRLDAVEAEGAGAESGREWCVEGGEGGSAIDGSVVRRSGGKNESL